MTWRVCGSLLVATLAVAAGWSQSEQKANFPSLRDPVFSSRGDLAVEIAGAVWVAEAASWRRQGLAGLRPLSGPGNDARQPDWLPGGEGLLFSSDRDGDDNIFRQALDGEPVRLTDSTDSDTEPSAGPRDRIVFVRGDGAGRRLWLREADGQERALTGRDEDEASPAWSPDGRHVVYVASGNQLRVWSFEEGSSRVVVEDLPVESPAWSPDGNLILFGARRGRSGLWLTDVEGRFTNLVAPEPAAAAWSPDGELLLVELPALGPGYNGDPERLADRAKQAAPLAGPARVWRLEAPRAPAEPQAVSSVPPFDGARYRRDALQQVWERLNALYVSARDRADWAAIGDEYARRAGELDTPEALDALIYDMVERRPAARREASGRAAVSSAHPGASAAGVEILELGGNVVDAAVAVSFALGVVEPDASGIGGYGEMLVSLEGMEEPSVIEFLTRVPEEATLDNAALLGSSLPRDGPMLVNVPGTVAGMWTAYQRFGSGRVEWRRLLEPAIRLAEQGFALDEAFPTTLRVERESFLRYPSSAKLFFPGGEPLDSGDTLRNPDLAWTLREIAEGGAEAFYEGTIARRMVRDLRGQGSPLKPTDLSRYFAAVRRPVTATYRGHTVFGAAPAASGGALLAAKLKLLEQAPRLRRYTRDAASLHAMIEAWKLTPSTRGRIADPGLWPTDTGPFVDGERAGRVWSRCFSADKSLTPGDLRRDGDRLACEREEATDLAWGASLDCPEAALGLPCRSTGTTAFAVGDGDGNLVSVTQTLGTWGGNFYVSPGLGFLYNDKLRSYGSDPDGYNARLPFARNGTSISPTLIFSGTGPGRRPLAALGAAGNAWITAAVYQSLVGIVDLGLGPQAALELPRFLVGRGSDDRPPIVQAEDGFAPDVVRQLDAMGHRIHFISLPGELRMGYAAAVVVRDGVATAGADPRRSGSGRAVE